MGDPAGKAEVDFGVKRSFQIPEKIKSFLVNYKYPLLILLGGLLLMLLPTKKKSNAAAATALPTGEQHEETIFLSEQDYCRQTEKKLEQILSQIQGAGKVSVMLTLDSGPETLYLSDSDLDRSSDGDRSIESVASKTVILSRGSSYNEAAIVKTEYPSFRGALIVTQGGDDASVRLKLTEAVSALLRLGSDKITVVKMK